MAEFVGGRISWVQFKASWMLPGCTSGTAGARWRRGRGAVAQFALDVFNWYLDVFNWYGELVHCVYKSVLRELEHQNGTHEQQFTTKLLLLNKTNQHSPVLKELEHQNDACELGRVRVTFFLKKNYQQLVPTTWIWYIKPLFLYHVKPLWWLACRGLHMNVSSSSYDMHVSSSQVSNVIHACILLLIWHECIPLLTGKQRHSNRQRGQLANAKLTYPPPHLTWMYPPPRR